MDKVNLPMPDSSSGVEKISIQEEEQRFTLTLKETDRLLFAKQVLLFIFIFSITIVFLAAFFPDNRLIEEMVDIIKIGALPLITLIVSFYFPQSIKDNKSS